MRPDTWFSRDLPVLETIATLFEERSGDPIDGDEIVERSGLTRADVATAVQALEAEHLHDVVWGGDWHPLPEPSVLLGGITNGARRELGMWPTPDTLADRAIAAIEERVSAARTPEERGRWVKIRDAVGGASRDLLVDVLGSVTAHTITGA